jgi:hypothetical protein
MAKLKITKSKTHRGFAHNTFVDYYGNKCSIQKSSLATDDAIWFGIDDAKPEVMAIDAAELGIKTNETTGWVPYPIPDNVSLHTRMHLTRDQVEQLLPILKRFVDTGNV